MVRLFHRKGYERVLSPDRATLPLLDRSSVHRFFDQQRPDHVFMCAARVGGIAANIASPTEFLAENLDIQSNLFDACRRFPTVKNVFLGSSCVYPRECPQPMREEYLLTGSLEPTNEGYALAKIAGLKLARAIWTQYGVKTICPMPCNVYGTGDHFDLDRSHVLSALVRRFTDAVDDGAREVTLWGTGVARREFLHVDDLARAVLFLMDAWDDPDIINVGAGADVSIAELAELVSEAVGYRGTIRWDTSKPDGMPRKCLDVSRLTKLGFAPSISLQEGIRLTVSEYRELRSQGKLT